uniref:RING-type domain-containing protein n=1 Tax=Palpitomonas bilix TaxID=652834 RepID=A0A7S3G327_9EUKA
MSDVQGRLSARRIPPTERSDLVGIIQALEAQLDAKDRDMSERKQIIRGMQAEVASLKGQIVERVRERDRAERKMEDMRAQLADERQATESLQESMRVAGEELRRVSALHEELMRERRGREEAESKIVRLEKQLERAGASSESAVLRADLRRVEEELNIERERRRKAERRGGGGGDVPSSPSSALLLPDLSRVRDPAKLEELEQHAEKFMREVRAAQVELLRRQKEELEEAKKCRVCLSGEITIVLVPCGHHCLCHECSLQLEECPLCRAPIAQRVKTYA